MPGSTQTEEPGCPTTTHIWAVPALEGSRRICIFQSSSARACIQSARRARACVMHVDSGCQLDQAWRFWIIPVIERARVHSAGQPRARMHHACGSWMSVGSDHACGFWMSVGSDHACSNHARACIMHAGYLAVARAHASCMQILHANSRCRICMAVIEFHAHIMQGAHIFPVNWLCTPFVCNSDHGSLINRILVTGKKWRDCWWRSHTG